LEGTTLPVAFKRSRELTRTYVVKTFLYTGFFPTILAMVLAVCVGFVEGALEIFTRGSTALVHTVWAGVTMALVVTILLSTHVLVTRMYVRLRGPDLR
jgi:hypothetical protein